MIEVRTAINCAECGNPCIVENDSGIALGKLEFFKCIFPSISDIYCSCDVESVNTAITEKAIQCSMSIYGKAPKTGSLNNCRGEWNELLFLDSVLTTLNRPGYEEYDVVKMPAARKGSMFFDLFEKNMKERIKSLKLSFSNPDFLIIKLNEKTKNMKFKSRGDHAQALIAKFKDKSYFGKIEPTDIVCFLSLKTSNRPDRRYQPLHEANSLKAIADQLGIYYRYIAVATDNSKKDDDVHGSNSIVSVVKKETPPRTAIDDIWHFDDYRMVERAIDMIIAMEPLKNPKPFSWS